jgi:hypothetical protein
MNSTFRAIGSRLWLRATVAEIRNRSDRLVDNLRTILDRLVTRTHDIRVRITFEECLLNVEHLLLNKRYENIILRQRIVVR